MYEPRNAKKSKQQHIQSFVRVRPLNNSERNGKSINVIDTPTNREVHIRERPQDKFTKKFTFDRVFGPLSKQIEVYNAVVRPLLEEVLAGYNCTVFAYGQTGTGKTFTMEGAKDDLSLHWENDTDAGIIPRALSHLFDELKALDVQEYTVRVSFLELYNEEVFDLLSSNEDTSKIRIYEDSARKGAVIVQGLEEVTVNDKIEVYKILQKGSDKRQTAATLMNANSSRSHTVFAITLHIKENTLEGEELLKTGKLNLVDLAGSENIGRSGAVDKRAREAGNINQSLLTLGRVITALVERTPHVPYRESKLTRLLQESLGGRTKTSIIATVSPASINLEETLSTLDYAHRAKNITNRPEINQKLSKKALLHEYTEEIEKLRRDLLATRERNGVYLALDNYNEMQNLIECQSKEIEEKLNHINALLETTKTKEEIFNDLKTKHVEQANELLNAKNELETTAYDLKLVAARLEMTENEKEEQKHLVEKHISTEKILLTQAQTLLKVADATTEDVEKLHDKIMRKKQVEERNKYIGQQLKDNASQHIYNIETDVSTHAQNFMQFCASIKDQIDEQIVLHNKGIDTVIKNISENFICPDEMATNKLTETVHESHSNYDQWLKNEIDAITNVTEFERDVLTDVSSRLVPQIKQLIENEIAENLRALDLEILQKVNNMTTHAQKSIAAACNYGQEECNRLCCNIDEIKEIVNDTLKDQNRIMEKRENFAKTMEDLHSRFNDLKKEGDVCHSAICDALNNVNEMCNNINSQTLNTYSMYNDGENRLKDQLINDIEIVKNDISSETGKCRVIAKNAVVQGNILFNAFKADISNSCDALESHKNRVKHSTKEMQEIIRSQKNNMLTSIQENHTSISNASADHTRYLETCKTVFSDTNKELGCKLQNQDTNIVNNSGRVNAELRTIRNRVDKFFVEELSPDTPTGSTPEKKNFQYPGKLTATSSHEIILKRFRETNKDIDTLREKESNTMT